MLQFCFSNPISQIFHFLNLPQLELLLVYVEMGDHELHLLAVAFIYNSLIWIRISQENVVSCFYHDNCKHEAYMLVTIDMGKIQVHVYPQADGFTFV